MFQDLIKKTQDDIENWNWENKKKELKAHYYKYRYHYAIATVLILIIVIIEEQNIPPIMIGGNEEGGEPKNPDEPKLNKENPGETKKPDKSNDKKTGEPKEKKTGEPKENKPGDAKVTSGENDLIGDKKGTSVGNNLIGDGKGKKKGSKGMGKGFNISSMKGPFNDGIKKFGGSVYNMIKKILRIIGYVFLAAFIVVIPALIYLVLVYLMFKLIVKGSIKM